MRANPRPGIARVLSDLTNIFQTNPIIFAQTVCGDADGCKCVGSIVDGLFNFYLEFEMIDKFIKIV